MPARIVVIAEAEADRRIVCDLIDRKIRHHAPDWLDPDHLEDYREWRGVEPGQLFTPWKTLKRMDDSRYCNALRAPGGLGFTGLAAGGFDGAATRKALICCALLEPRPEAVVLVRDMDNQLIKRRASIEAERSRVAQSPEMTVILALPNAKREAWVLNGFVARTDQEDVILDDLKRDLGFHPCTSAEKLITTSGHKKDAKRVAGFLFGNDRSREESCWQDTDWSILRERGMNTGLQDFLAEVQARLLPVIIGQ